MKYWTCSHSQSYSMLLSHGLAKIAKQTKTIISPLRLFITTKLGSMVTYLKTLPSIKSRESLITWSCEIMWQTETIISPQIQCLLTPNLLEWWLTPTVKVTLSFDYETNLRSRCNSKNLCLRFHKINLAEYRRQGGASARKHLSCRQLLVIRWNDL